MHRGGMSLEGGKGGGGMGRNGYRRDYRQPDRSGFMDRSSGTADNSASKGSYAGQAARAVEQPLPSATPQTVVSELEKRLSGVQQDFTQQLHKISEKENEKFDLIFAILSELQSRQAQLEESVRTLKAQYGGGQMVGANQMGGNSTAPALMNHQHQNQTHQAQFNNSSNGHQYGQMSGQMNGQMNANMGNHQTMQQFSGVMQPDGTQAMFTAVPQVVVVQSPTAGMQYAMPQMMSPTGTMQPMPAQMAMQFIGQSQGQDMGHFVNGQDNAACSCSGAQSQVQPNQGQHALANASSGAADVSAGQPCQAEDSNAQQLHSMPE